MVNKCGVSLLLTQQKMSYLFSDLNIKKIALDTPDVEAALARESEQNPAREPGFNSQSLAYVIFTSGSTGLPKPIGMPHLALLNLIFAMGNDCPQLSDKNKVLQYSTLNFDMSYTELFLALLNGGESIILPPSLQFDVPKLLNFIRDHELNILNLPYAMIPLLASSANSANIGFPDLRVIISTAEQLVINDEIKTFFDKRKHITLVNHYGPSETHVVTSTVLPTNVSDWPKNVSIGKPISNIQCHVLDANQKLVPPGAAGELYISGLGLARGYVNDDGLTSASFVPNPYSLDNNSRMYRTGDRVKWKADGSLDCLGRFDEQVKLRGFRIELGEVTNQLLTSSKVETAVTILLEKESGNKGIVSYVTLKDLNKDLSSSEVSEQLMSMLRQSLPEYMVPYAIVRIDSVPLTSNGKVNKAALPVPSSRDLNSEFVEASSLTEKELVDIWATLLKLPAKEISVTANFFTLGGHSLLLTQLNTFINDRWSVELPMKELFSNPSIANIANLLEEELTILSGISDSFSVDGEEEVLEI